MEKVIERVQVKEIPVVTTEERVVEMVKEVLYTYIHHTYIYDT